MATYEGFDTLVKDLLAATETLERAMQRERDATSESCACRNRVNEIQRALDAAMAELRKDAPRQSDWADQRMRQKAGA